MSANAIELDIARRRVELAQLAVVDAQTSLLVAQQDYIRAQGGLGAAIASAERELSALDEELGSEGAE